MSIESLRNMPVTTIFALVMGKEPYHFATTKETPFVLTMYGYGWLPLLGLYLSVLMPSRKADPIMYYYRSVHTLQRLSLKIGHL